MTTKFLDNKMCTFKILLSVAFPTRKRTAFWTIFLSVPNAPTQNRKFYFHIRLAISDTVLRVLIRKRELAEFLGKLGEFCKKSVRLLWPTNNWLRGTY